jgi:hypothetical protein
MITWAAIAALQSICLIFRLCDFCDLLNCRADRRFALVGWLAN